MDGERVPSPGWYPDRGGGQELRWWDGEAWTDNFTSLGVASHGTAAAEIEVSNSVAVLLDEQLPTNIRFRNRRLLVDECGITYGGDALQFLAVEGLAYYIVDVRMSGVKTLRKYTLELWGSHGGHVKVPMSADALNRRRAQHLATVFEALVAIAQERLEPALRHRFSSAVGAGRPVTIGSLSLAPAGLTFDRKLLSDRSVPWSSFAGTDIDHGEVRVFMRNGESTRMAGTVPLATRDAVLLPELLRELADLFS